MAYASRIPNRSRAVWFSLAVVACGGRGKPIGRANIEAGISDFGTGGSEPIGASGSSAGGRIGGTGGSQPAAGRSGTGGSSNGGGAGGTAGAATCSTAIGTTCDGPEDCATGQHCCGKYEMAYVEIGCFDSCTAQNADGGFVMFGAIWYELCHPNDACEDSTATCSTSQYLPSSLARCLPAPLGMPMSGTPDPTLGHDKNAVNCGTSVCGATEQCCIRQPLAPYCTPKSATCDCKGS